MDADRAESICPGCSGNRSQLRWQLGDRLFRTTDKQFGIQECPDCSLLFLWPVPPADELAGYYPFGYWAGDPSVTGDPSVNGAGLHRRVTEAYRRFMLRDHVRFVRGAIAIQSHLGKSTVDLLDVGCGDGSFLLVTRYDGELLFLDTHLSRLIERLRQHQSWDEMLLVITSDHGEAFGEHDLVGHSSSLYDVMIRVPLILKLPRDSGLQDAPAAGARWLRRMQLADIAPVVLAHAGVDGSMDMDGRGLDADPSTLRAWSYPSMALRGADDRYRRELRSIEDGVWKLIEDDRGTVELYDLQSDPEEETNLASRHGMRVETMRAELGPRQPQTPRDRDPPELSEESLERLRSLGYVR